MAVYFLYLRFAHVSSSEGIKKLHSATNGRCTDPCSGNVHGEIYGPRKQLPLYPWQTRAIASSISPLSLSLLPFSFAITSPRLRAMSSTDNVLRMLNVTNTGDLDAIADVIADYFGGGTPEEEDLIYG